MLNFLLCGYVWVSMSELQSSIFFFLLVFMVILEIRLAYTLFGLFALVFHYSSQDEGKKISKSLVTCRYMDAI